MSSQQLIQQKQLTEDDIIDLAYEAGFAMGETMDQVKGSYEEPMLFAKLVLREVSHV